MDLKRFILNRVKETGEADMLDLRQELLRGFREALRELANKGLVKLREETILIEPVPENLLGEVISGLSDVKPWVRETLEKYIGEDWREHVNERIQRTLIGEKLCIECGNCILECERISPCEARIVKVKKV